MSSDPRAHIRAFVVGRFPAVRLDDAQDIFALGFVNSLFAMELVLFLEQQFAMQIPNEDLHLDNFRTIDAMAALVGRRASLAA